MDNSPDLNQRSIALVGMMGVGKSHIGSKLAQKLGLNFFDSDHIIEEKAGRSVTEIFESFGEKKFRQAERNTIIELLNGSPCVIATGGGSVTDAEVLEALKAQAITIWLKSSPENIYKRVKNSDKRPLLQSDDPLQTLRNLLNDRQNLYAQAHIHIDLDEQSVHYTLETVIKTLSEFVKNDRF